MVFPWFFYKSGRVSSCEALSPLGTFPLIDRFKASWATLSLSRLTPLTRDTSESSLSHSPLYIDSILAFRAARRLVAFLWRRTNTSSMLETFPSLMMNTDFVFTRLAASSWSEVRFLFLGEDVGDKADRIMDVAPSSPVDPHSRGDQYLLTIAKCPSEEWLSTSTKVFAPYNGKYWV